MDKIVQVINQCAHGYSVTEYMGATAERYPRPVRSYMESRYRRRHQEIYGCPWTSRQEKARLSLERIKSLGDGAPPKPARRSS